DDPQSAVLIEGHRDGALDLGLGGDEFDAQAGRDTEGGTGLFGCQRTARWIGLLWRTIVALTLRVRKPPHAEGEGYDLRRPERRHQGKAEEQRQGGRPSRGKEGTHPRVTFAGGIACRSSYVHRPAPAPSPSFVPKRSRGVMKAVRRCVTALPLF